MLSLLSVPSITNGAARIQASRSGFVHNAFICKSTEGIIDIFIFSGRKDGWYDIVLESYVILQHLRSHVARTKAHQEMKHPVKKSASLHNGID